MKKAMILLIAALMLLSACAAAQELRVDFYDMGKADAMLITTPSGYRILIDAGTNKGGKALVSRFEKEKIKDLDMMIITHYDKDHVGGGDKILEDVGVKEVVMPVYAKESKQYTQFAEALEETDTKASRLKIGSEMTVTTDDGVTMFITAAHKPSYGKDEENDFSLSVRLTYGETKFLFAGDAEDPRQRELLKEGDVACDVLKVPYHGRLVNASEEFLTEANPKIAFITDSEEEPASEKVIRILENLGADVRSAKDGDIAVVSDGKNVRIL